MEIIMRGMVSMPCVKGEGFFYNLFIEEHIKLMFDCHTLSSPSFKNYKQNCT